MESNKCGEESSALRHRAPPPARQPPHLTPRRPSFLSCGLCGEAFGSQPPKVLPCFHMFHAECLENSVKRIPGQEFYCKVCFSEITLPSVGLSGFKDSHFVTFINRYHSNRMDHSLDSINGAILPFARQQRILCQRCQSPISHSSLESGVSIRSTPSTGGSVTSRDLGGETPDSGGRAAFKMAATTTAGSVGAAVTTSAEMAAAMEKPEPRRRIEHAQPRTAYSAQDIVYPLGVEKRRSSKPRFPFLEDNHIQTIDQQQQRYLTTLRENTTSTASKRSPSAPPVGKKIVSGSTVIVRPETSISAFKQHSSPRRSSSDVTNLNNNMSLGSNHSMKTASSSGGNTSQDSDASPAALGTTATAAMGRRETETTSGSGGSTETSTEQHNFRMQMNQQAPTQETPIFVDSESDSLRELHLKMEVNCKIHALPMQLYCQICLLPICSGCKSKGHSRHKCLALSSVVPSFTNRIQTSMKPVDAKVEQAEMQLQELDLYQNSFERWMSKMKTDVESRAQNLIALIKQKTAELFRELEQIETKIHEKLEKHKENVTNQLKRFRSAKDFTEQLLNNGSDYEIVNFGPELEESAKNLSKLATPNMDKKLYHFQPGDIFRDFKMGIVKESTFQSCDLLRIFTPGCGPITSVDIKNDEVVVCGEESGDILVCKESRLLKRLTPTGKKPHQLKILPDGQICLTHMDSKGFTLIARDDETSISTYGRDYIAIPRGVCLNSNGDIIISDTMTEKIFVHSKAGKLVNTIRNTSERRILDYPVYVCCTEDDSIVVADQFQNHIVLISADGGEIARYGKLGKGEHELDQPSGLCLDYYGNIVVCDTNNHRIHLLSPQLQFKKYLLEDAGHDMYKPTAVALDKANSMLVIGQANGVLKIFKWYG